MAKNTDVDKELIKEKLEYIGLDLNKVPKFLKEYEPLNFRPVRAYNQTTTYKVYKHINVQDIEILITPSDRLTDLKERYKLSSPLYTYLMEDDEEGIEKFSVFLTMLSNMQIEKVEELENEQKELKKHLPTKIKYKNHFIWQIYYSDYAQKYFMLVPTNEQDNSELFYILKKQISSKKTRKKETIFVPIAELEYSGIFLSNSEIADIENYLWYFTKEWPSIYEVYDLKNKLSLKIVGTTNVYEKVKSDFTISIESKEDAINFYKLLKAMFILSTGIPEEYKFQTKISADGNLQFYFKDKEISYESLSEFVKSEFEEKRSRLKTEIDETKKLQKRLKKFNLAVEELTEDYLERQRQISTFLECKKSFFGKVKYFFKKKKVVTKLTKPIKQEREEIKKEDSISKMYEEKEQYTIEDLIGICTNLEEKLKENTNLQLDINAIETKRDVLTKKIDNADLYIKEIDSHKKSIFEFWKFTSKDEKQTLAEGEDDEDIKKEKIEKYFDYEEDLEDLGIAMDELQRRKLSKTETDAIFAGKYIMNVYKTLDESENKKVIENELKRLKDEYKNDLEYISIKDFDIFGGLSEDKTKIKTINNQKHREIEKDKYTVLNLNLDTELDSFRDNAKHNLALIKEAFNKIKTQYNISVYKLNNDEKIEGIEICDINPQNAIRPLLKGKEQEGTLCKINVKENMPMLFFSNIIFYDNSNKTLPVGMNLSTEVMVDLNKIEIECIKTLEFNINVNITEFEVQTKKIKVYEYTAKEIM